MKKLNLNDLAVESFATGDDRFRKGTVLGHMPPYSMWTCPLVGCADTSECGGGGTEPPTMYDQTCQETCADGCHLSLYGDPAAFTCDPNCLSYATNCHRCTF